MTKPKKIGKKRISKKRQGKNMLLGISIAGGLIVALTGIYFASRLRQLADLETSRLADKLTLHTENTDKSSCP
jgi:hypothetical protein